MKKIGEASLQSDKLQRPVRVLTYLQRGVHHESTPFAQHRSIYFLLICSAFHHLASHLWKMCFFKGAECIRDAVSSSKSSNLHSTLRPRFWFPTSLAVFPYKYKNLAVLLLYKDTYLLKKEALKVLFLQKQPVLLQNAVCTSTLTKVGNMSHHHHQHRNPFATFNALTML